MAADIADVVNVLVRTDVAAAAVLPAVEAGVVVVDGGTAVVAEGGAAAE